VKPRVSGREARELAHDLNNLLTAMITAADEVLERSGIDPETRADVVHIREGARRGAALVRRLRGDTDDAPEPVSVSETIRSTQRLLASRLDAKVTLALDLVEACGRSIIDPAQLDRVLLNLVANASQAMPDGGVVTVATARRAVATEEVRVPDTIPPGDYVVILVSDTGIGISPERMPRIFDFGFSSRRKQGGSGLGLASVRDVVRLAKGFVSVSSVERQGTRFEIWLPRVPDAVSRDVGIAAAAVTARTVLLVEDDPLVRRVAERMLHRAGWTVLSAESGDTALAILQRTSCDLMISDLAMPGMDGLDLTRRVQRKLPELPVILTSAYNRVTVGEPLPLANVEFLVKPYGRADLLAAVARIMGTQPDGSPRAN
jgi:two-component system cell cycle sensor histidine kinase/response regulator CckA